MVMTILVLLVLIFTSDSKIYYGALFLNGILIGIKQFIVYSHIMEFMSLKTTFISGLFFFVDGSVFTISPLVIYFISNNTMILIYIALILAVGTQIACLTVFYIPESLKFSLSKGYYQKVEADIDYILKMNKAGEEVRH